MSSEPCYMDQYEALADRWYAVLSDHEPTSALEDPRGAELRRLMEALWPRMTAEQRTLAINRRVEYHRVRREAGT